MAEFIEVSQKNLGEIKSRLDRGEGRILISEPNRFSFGESCELSLYDNPKIHTKVPEGFLYTERGSKMVNGESWQTNWENDRNYSLRPLPKPAEDETWNLCREMFDNLRIGEGYQFQIGFQSVCGRTLFSEGGLILYIERKKSMVNAFFRGISHAVDLVNRYSIDRGMNSMILDDIEIPAMVEYAMKDLETSEVFRKNVKAGLVADEMLF